MHTRNANARQQRRDVLRALLAVGGATGLDALTCAEELFLPPPEPTLRVLFFNTHLLPRIARAIAGHRGQDDYRTRTIAARLYPYDIVGLCEVFSARRRREILQIVGENSGRPIQWIESPDPSGRHVVSGGLLLLSQLPVEAEPHFLTYSKASRAYSHGYKADGFAAKGALHARFCISPDLSVDCFLTHLESVSSIARAAQIAELADFIVAHSCPDRPLILMGDMNVVAHFPIMATPAGSEYRLLTSAVQHAGQPLVDVWGALEPTLGGTRDALAHERCDRIDYIFTSRPCAPGAPWLQPTEVRVEPFLDGNVKEGSLSDHAGIECRLAVRSR